MKWNTEQTKLCQNCNNLLPLTEEFWNSPFKQVQYCSSCRHKVDLIQKKQYREKYPHKVKESRKTHYSDPDNKKKKQAQDRVYAQNNKEKIQKRQNEWAKNSIKSRLHTLVSHRIREALLRTGHTKNGGKSFDYLGYSVEELKSHIEKLFEPWMNWKNWGLYKLESWDDNNPETWTWNVDHITPRSQLPYSSMEDENFKKCWALENLRPLSAKVNVLRKNREESYVEILKESIHGQNTCNS